MSRNRLVLCVVAGWEKRFVITGLWHDVMLQKVVSRIDLWNIVLSTVVCEIHLVEPDMV